MILIGGRFYFVSPVIVMVRHDSPHKYRVVVVVCGICWCDYSHLWLKSIVAVYHFDVVNLSITSPFLFLVAVFDLIVFMAAIAKMTQQYDGTWSLSTTRITTLHTVVISSTVMQN